MPPFLTPRVFSIQDSPVIKLQALSVAFDFDESETLRKASLRLGIFLGQDKASIKARIDQSLSHSQGYTIKTKGSTLHLKSRTEMGVFYGLQFINWIQNNSSGKIPSFKLQDWPDLETRGYMLDISRCKVPKIESLFQLINTLSELRYNQLQLYTEHTFAYKNHQIVWQEASPYTHEEIQAIDTYCKERFIELVPNQNSFGHLERWLRHDDYKHLAECPNGYIHPLKGALDHGGTLKPNHKSIAFIGNLYDELLPNFSSNQINIGCDETWELGHGWSSDKIAQSSKRTVYLDFLLQINETAKKRGYSIQYWGDIILESPELIKCLPQDGIALVWGYEAGHPFKEQCAAFQETGIPYLVAPGTSSWNTIGGRYENAKQNIDDAIRQAITQKAKGFLLTDWGDEGHHQSPLISLPAIARAATIAWNRPAEIENNLQNIILNLSQEPNLLPILEKLGRLPDLFNEKPHNYSPLNRLLFSDLESSKHHLKSSSIQELTNATTEINAIRSSLSSLKNPAIRDSIELSLELLMFSCEKGCTLLSNEPFPNNHTEKSITEIANRFKNQWLTTNRPGGLKESVGKLLVNNLKAKERN